jgi:hypothetical protein
MCLFLCVCSERVIYVPFFMCLFRACDLCAFLCVCTERVIYVPFYVSVPSV